MKKVKRQEGIDLLKVIAIMSIPFLHFCSYFYKEQQDYVKFIGMHMMRWMSFTSVGLFITISGFLYSSKTYTKEYFTKILLFYFKYFIYCFLTSLIIDGNIKYLWGYFFRYPGYFWYVSFWIGMLFIIPFLNIAIRECNKKEYMIIIFLLFLLLSLPKALEQFNDMYNTKIHLPMYWHADNFPILYYIIGAGFKKYHLQFSKKFVWGE